MRFWSFVAILIFASPLAAQERALAPVEVVPPPAFQRAIERGTRTTSGVPGPRYWQQRVDYDIAVTVDSRTRLLTGQETIVYANRSIAVEATIEGEVAAVELDPEGLFADVDPSDDRWEP